jgi:hypothetical protein
MGRVFDRMTEYDEKLRMATTPSKLIEQKIIPFMDYIDQEI